MLYFAYGSNLNLSQMSRRCPAAVPLDKLYLPNTRLVFRGVADVVFAEGFACPGGLWKITPDCEARLDRYEGYQPDDRGMYSKEFVAVEGLPDGETEVMLYTMNSTGIFPPSQSYYQGIVDGYQDFGLRRGALKAALKHSYDDKHPSHVERQRTRRMGRPALAPRPVVRVDGVPVESAREVRGKFGPKPGRESKRKRGKVVWTNHDPWADTSWAAKPKRKFKNLNDWIEDQKASGRGF